MRAAATRARALSGAGWRPAAASITLSGSVLLGNAVSTLVLARLTGPRGYGLFVVGMSTALLLAIPAVLGMAPLLLRTVAAARVVEDWGRLRGAVRRARQAAAASSLIIVTVAGLAIWLLGDGGPTSRVLLLALPLVPLLAAATVQQASMQGLGHVSRGRVPEAVVRPLLFLALIGLLSSWGTLSGATTVLCMVGATAVALGLGALLLSRALPAAVRRAPPVYDDRAWAATLVPLMVLNGISVLNERADVLLLSAMRGPDAAGVFSVADRAASLTSFFLLAATYPLSPVVARLWATGDRAALQRVVRSAAKAVTAGGVVVATGLVLVSGSVLQWFGAGFSDGRTALVVLCAGELVNVVTGVVGLVLVMTGHEGSVARGVGLGAVVGIGLTLVLIPPFGTTGAAVGTAAGVVLRNLWLTRSLWRATGIWAAALGTPRPA